MKRVARRLDVHSLWRELARQLDSQRIALFLDYDGTLVEITGQPEQAVLSTARRAQLDSLALRFPTTILTGRARAQVQKLVGIPHITYAGAHGFDILLAGTHEHFVVDPAMRSEIDGASELVRTLTRDLPGVLIENKEYAIAVHYRSAPRAERRLADLLDSAVRSFPALQRTSGHMLFELRPRTDWDKGQALRWILGRLEIESALPVFIGDDTTDEDAFAAVAESGVGIAVGSRVTSTAARYLLDSVDDVYSLLDRISTLST